MFSRFVLKVVALIIVAAPLALDLSEAKAQIVFCRPGIPCPLPSGINPRPSPPDRPNSFPSSSSFPAPGFCPPGTILDPVINRCVSVTTPPRPMPPFPPQNPNGRVMRPIPPSSNEIDEISAANIVNDSLRGLSCGQASESLRRLSNQILSLGISANAPTIPGRPEPDFKRQWRERIRSQAFWRKVWNRMADAYRSCDRGCFDDGVAVGQISATGYCSASIAVDGLLGPGMVEQPSLPVCETATFAGCIKGYQSTAGGFPGCSKYTTSGFDSIFREYISQDCHL